MGQVSNQSSNFILRPSLFSWVLVLAYICICCVRVTTAYHESGHHHFWAQVFQSFWLSAFHVSNMESAFSFYFFLNLFFCIAMDEVGG